MTQTSSCLQSSAPSRAGRGALVRRPHYTSEPIVNEYERVLGEVGAVDEAEERALIEAFASGEGVLYTANPPPIEGASSDPDDDKFLECALELGADRVVSGDTDLLELKSYMGIPIPTPREFLERIGEVPGE